MTRIDVAIWASVAFIVVCCLLLFLAYLHNERENERIERDTQHLLDRVEDVLGEGEQ